MLLFFHSSVWNTAGNETISIDKISLTPDNPKQVAKTVTRVKSHAKFEWAHPPKRNPRRTKEETSDKQRARDHRPSVTLATRDSVSRSNYFCSLSSSELNSTNMRKNADVMPAASREPRVMYVNRHNRRPARPVWIPQACRGIVPQIRRYLTAEFSSQTRPPPNAPASLLLPLFFPLSFVL